MVANHLCRTKEERSQRPTATSPSYHLHMQRLICLLIGKTTTSCTHCSVLKTCRSSYGQAATRNLRGRKLEGRVESIDDTGRSMHGRFQGLSQYSPGIFKYNLSVVFDREAHSSDIITAAVESSESNRDGADRTEGHVRNERGRLLVQCCPQQSLRSYEQAESEGAWDERRTGLEVRRQDQSGCGGQWGLRSCGIRYATFI